MKINLNLKNKEKYYKGYVTKNISSTDEYEEATFKFVILAEEKPILLWLDTNLNNKEQIEKEILETFNQVNNTKFVFDIREHDLNDKKSSYLNENTIPPKR